MSLTSMLSGKEDHLKEFQNIIRFRIPKKSDFFTLSNNNAFSKKEYRSRAPYVLKNQYNASVVGIAFDYLARIMIARVLGNIEDKEGAYKNLIAEKGLNIISKVLKNHKETMSKIIIKYEKSLLKIENYVRNEKPVKDLIPIAYFFAKLEQTYRSGIPPIDIKESLLGEPSSDITADLANICNVFQSEFIDKGLVTFNSKVIFNPNFGAASMLVGGADGDIYIDGVLYDFKTTKYVGYKWKEIAQLLGYFYLNQLSKEMKRLGVPYPEDEMTIETVAFYKARYGEIEAFDVSAYDSNFIKEVVMELVNYFNKYPTRGMVFSPLVHETIVDMGEELLGM